MQDSRVVQKKNKTTAASADEEGSTFWIYKFQNKAGKWGENGSENSNRTMQGLNPVVKAVEFGSSV